MGGTGMPGPQQSQSITLPLKCRLLVTRAPLMSPGLGDGTQSRTGIECMFYH